MQKKIGVCFLILGVLNGELVVYCVKENKPKPEILKEGGEVGPPFETFQEADKIVENTLFRLIMEETLIDPRDVTIRQIGRDLFKLFPEQPHIFTMWAWATYHGASYEVSGAPEDKEVSLAGWKTLEQLSELKQRVETPTIIQAFKSIGGVESALYLLKKA